MALLIRGLKGPVGVLQGAGAVRLVIYQSLAGDPFVQLKVAAVNVGGVHMGVQGGEGQPPALVVLIPQPEVAADVEPAVGGLVREEGLPLWHYAGEEETAVPVV